LANRSRGLDEAPDGTLDDIQRKAEQFHRLVVSEDYRQAQRVADAWCAAFVWPKHPGAPADPITTDTIRRLQEDAEGRGAAQRSELERLAVQYRFFHWHLACPEVFARGGFDCVLGNPPWENIKADPVEFFAAVAPEVAMAPTADARSAKL